MRVHLDECGSTQDEARRLVATAAARSMVVVTADRQLDGRGRDGRRWEQPPGEAVFASIGVRGPVEVRLLEGLPHDIARIILDVAWSEARVELAWKAPNDVVAVGDGAKVGGILVDARTMGDTVREVVVGVGVNVAGAAFTTADGRDATTLAALGGDATVEVVRDAIVDAVAARLSG